MDLPAPFGPSRPRIAPRSALEGDARDRPAAAEVTGDVVDRQVVEIEPAERVEASRGDVLAASLRPRAPRPARRRSVRAPRAAAAAARRQTATLPAARAGVSSAASSASSVFAALRSSRGAVVVGSGARAERQPRADTDDRRRPGRAPRSAASGCAPEDSRAASSACRPPRSAGPLASRNGVPVSARHLADRRKLRRRHRHRPDLLDRHRQLLAAQPATSAAR